MFVTFEGIEGVGKSTQIKHVSEFLTARNIKTVVTREPGGTELGEELRNVLLTQRAEIVTPMAELLMIFAARAQHVDTVILPALRTGAWVLCDRFVDATYAYQGGGRGLPLNIIQGMENLVLGDFKPDYTLIFDAPIRVGLDRIKIRGTMDRFEQEQVDFFERVRAVYHNRALQNPKRYRLIDATLPIELVQKAVLDIMTECVSIHELHPLA
jgi:dTMP kinase